MAEMTYAVHTRTCTYLLDDEGICLWTLSPGGHAAPDTDRCVGAQFVACLDLTTPGGLVGELRLGAAALFARREHGRFVLLRTLPIERVEQRQEDEQNVRAYRDVLTSQDATAVLAAHEADVLLAGGTPLIHMPVPAPPQAAPIGARATPPPPPPRTTPPPPPPRTTPAPPPPRAAPPAPHTPPYVPAPLPAVQEAPFIHHAPAPYHAPAHVEPQHVPAPYHAPAHHEPQRAPAPHHEPEVLRTAPLPDQAWPPVPRAIAPQPSPGSLQLTYESYGEDDDVSFLDSEDLVSISVTEVAITQPLYRPPPGTAPAPLPAYVLPPPAPPPRRPSVPDIDAGPPTPRGPAPQRRGVVGPGRRLR